MKCFICNHNVADDLVYPGWYHCAHCLEDFPSDEVILEFPPPYICHWCDKETFNPPTEVLNDLLQKFESSWCNECRKASEECGEIAREKPSS